MQHHKVLRLPQKTATQIETRLESIAPATQNVIRNRNACHITQQNHAICDEIDLQHMIL